MFTPFHGLNTSFYKTVALNIFRFGQFSQSPYMGLANYPLRKTFHYTFGSLFPFWLSSNMTILLGLTGLVAFHFLWIPHVHYSLLIGILILFLISSTFYLQFRNQNYNVLGWLFFPILLFACLQNHLLLIAIALLVCSFFSFTVWFIGSILIGIWSVSTLNILLLITLIPAGLKIATHFLPFLAGGQLRSVLLVVMKSIGMTSQNVKYKQSRMRSISWLGARFYVIGLYIVLALSIFLLHHEIPLLLLIGIGIAIVNFLLARFADDQSIYMLLSCLGIAYTLHINEPLLCVPLWLALNPLPKALNIKSAHPFFLPVLHPFYIQDLTTSVEQFLSYIPKHKRVFIAFDNPNDDYEKIFDGYRVLIELPHYVANQQYIHFMPDWWSVFELNYEGSPELWGRSVNEVKQNIQHWQADYIIVYQVEQSDLDPKWQQEGFELVSSLDWNHFQNILKEDSIFQQMKLPKWWLLKPVY